MFIFIGEAALPPRFGLEDGIDRDPVQVVEAVAHRLALEALI
jgi:hypothetical protein